MTRVRAAFLAEAERSRADRLRAALRAWRARAVLEGAPRLSRRRALVIARERVVEGRFVVFVLAYVSPRRTNAPVRQLSHC